MRFFFKSIAKIYHQNLRDLGYMARESFHKIDTTEFDIKSIFSGYYSHTRDSNKIHSEFIRKITPQVNLFE